jgi:hypothetical protein
VRSECSTIATILGHQPLNQSRVRNKPCWSLKSANSGFVTGGSTSRASPGSVQEGINKWVSWGGGITTGPQDPPAPS